MNKTSTYSVRHAIPGRLRLTLGRSVRVHGVFVRSRLQEREDVVWARYNAACGSLVLRHDPALDTQTLLAAIGQLLPAPERGHAGQSMQAQHPACEHPDSATDGCSLCAVARRGGTAAIEGQHPVRHAARNLALVSAMGVGALAVSGFSWTTLTAAVGILNPVSLLAFGAALPLLRATFKDVKKRSVTLESFLGGAVALAILAGEAVTALEILWIHAAGELLTAWITERSRKAIGSILDVAAKNTFLLVDGVELEVAVADVKPGDVVVLHTGERIAVDGVVTSGEALVDEATITGRPDFVRRAEGDLVFAGTFVRQGVLYVRVAEVGDSTYLARILCMVEDSLEHRAPIEGVGTELARRLVKLGFLATGVTFFLTGSLWRAFTVMLVMACPCATTLSASTAVGSALSAAAKRGILIKGGRYLEEIGSTDTVCFDKTGTLTVSEPSLSALASLNSADEHELLLLAASAEAHNFHPLALAIKTAAAERGIEPLQHEVCDYILGRGVRAVIRGQEILVGSRAFMDERGVDVKAYAHKTGGMKRRGLTVLYVTREGQVLGVLGFANRERPEAFAVVETLRKQGITRGVLITGDEERTARDLAERLAMDDCHASVMPEDKGTIVAGLRARGAKVLMVGDGINDALALAEADVGVAMGAGGSEVAIEAADIALINDDLEGLAYVHALSRRTIETARLNFWLATATNLGGAAAGALGLLSPVMAGLLHILHTGLVLGNSSRLLRYQGPVLALPEATRADETETSTNQERS